MQKNIYLHATNTETLLLFKKAFIALFYGWGSTASRLEPLRGSSLLFNSLPLSSQKFLIFILSTLKGYKAELTLEPPIG